MERVAFTTRRDITSAGRICGSREWKREDDRVEEVAYRSAFSPTIDSPYDNDRNHGNCRSIPTHIQTLFNDKEPGGKTGASSKYGRSHILSI